MIEGLCPSVSSSYSYKILFVGGPDTGKTSLIARIMKQPYPSVYVKTLLSSRHIVEVNSRLCSLWDISSDVTTRENDIASLIFSNVDAVFVVVDAGSKTSLIDADNWINLLYRFHIPVEKTTLLVNKADSSDLVVNQDTLDTFVALGGCSNWYWTVSHELFRDYCPRRGRIANQDPPKDILVRKVRELFLQDAGKVPVVAVDKVVDKCLKYRSDPGSEVDLPHDEGMLPRSHIYTCAHTQARTFMRTHIDARQTVQHACARAYTQAQ